MKRYVGIHLNPSALRAALLVGEKPVLVPTREGGWTYPTTDLFELSDGNWVCDSQRLERLLGQVRVDVERFAGPGQWEMVLVLPLSFGQVLEQQVLRPSALRAGLPVAYTLRECAAVALNYFWNGMGRGEEKFRIAVGMVSPQTISVSVLESEDCVVEELAVTSKRGGISPEALRYKMQRAMEETEQISPLDTLPVPGAGIRALLLNNEAVRKPEYRDVLTGLKRSGQKVYGYPDETAALGAALMAARLGGDRRVQEPLLLQVLGHDYYVMLADHRRIKLLSSDLTIPTRKSMVFSTVKDQQTSALIRITESEGEASHLETVRKVEQTGLTPRPARETRIEVTMEVNTAGVISCTAKELAPNEVTQAASAGGLPPVRDISQDKSKEQQLQDGPLPQKEQKAGSQGAMVSLAEFENFRRRMLQEKEAMYDQGIKKALEKFLPVVDNFERGLSMLSPDQKDTEAAVGMERIYRQMLKAMEELGVTPIVAVGQPFDLHRHNAVMQTEIPGVAENIIVEEFEKGYMYRDTVLRYSTVKVNK